MSFGQKQTPGSAFAIPHCRKNLFLDIAFADKLPDGRRLIFSGEHIVAEFGDEPGHPRDGIIFKTNFCLVSPKALRSFPHYLCNVVPNFWLSRQVHRQP